MIFSSNLFKKKISEHINIKSASFLNIVHPKESRVQNIYRWLKKREYFQVMNLRFFFFPILEK